jgi:hypothetical protein
MYTEAYVPSMEPSNCLKYVTPAYYPDLVDLTQYVGVTHFKQLEGCMGGTVLLQIVFSVMFNFLKYFMDNLWHLKSLDYDQEKL